MIKQLFQLILIGQYVNDLNSMNLGPERNEIPLGAFGQLALFGGVRYDKYDKGYNPYTKHYASGEDSTLRTQLKLNHTIQAFLIIQIIIIEK